MTIELLAGETMGGKYRIERLIGRGAVGTVYAARHSETGKRVALKCVDASHSVDPASAERLVREAQAAARIRHANVVDVYDVGRDGKLIFLVMEYLEGEPLSAFIARKGLPVFELIAMLLPAMRGVAEAHRQGVVHRDIKPENIFLARQVDAAEPIAKVLDFGISKLDARGVALRTLTADGYAIGTPGYMAYEQAIGERSIDGRADVYAFGAILYEALTGDVPHTARDFGALVRHFLTQNVQPPIELRADIPKSLSALVMWAIARDREQRVSSMEALIRELEPFSTERGYQKEQAAAQNPMGGLTLVGPWGLSSPPARDSVKAASAAPASVSRAAPSTVDTLLQLKRSRRRRARSAWLLASLAVLALGGAAFAWWSEPQPSAAAHRHSVSAATVQPRVDHVEPAPALDGPSELPLGAAPPPALDAPRSAAPSTASLTATTSPPPKATPAAAHSPNGAAATPPAKPAAAPSGTATATPTIPVAAAPITAQPKPSPAAPKAPAAGPKPRDFGIY
jgi:eukaryotic-like serine/threonine-protein kinase